MSTEIRVVHPKDKPLRRVFQKAFPRLHERLTVLNLQRKDRRYLRQQRQAFAALSEAATKPSHIEIETLNRCNNTCGFCPVNRHDDPRVLTRMDEALFHRIIDDLAAWGYDRTLNLFSNNEPFLDKRIFAFAAYAREKLPNAYIQIITNGMALDAAKAEAILPLLSHMVINNYATTLDLHANIATLKAKLEAERPDLAEKVVIGLRLLDEFKSNRGGTAPNRKVRDPLYRSRCAYPWFQMVVRPDGKVSLCCNDALGRETIGDVAADGIRAAWEDQRRAEVQRLMMDGRDRLDICRHCDNLAWAKPRRVSESLRDGHFTSADE